MVSPNLSKKTDSPLTLIPTTHKLFQIIYGQKLTGAGSGDDESPKIHVSHIVSNLSFLYEKVRNAVDYDDDHLLRKNAIKRILKRQIFIEGAVMDYDSEQISLTLLTELIQAGYLPNDKVPEIKIREVAILLEKYIKLRQSFKEIFPGGLEVASEESNERSRIINWIISLAATEIEEDLNYDKIRIVIVGNLFDTLSKLIKLPPDLPYQKDLDIQIYLSIARNFLKLDREMLSFLVFKYYNDWAVADDNAIENIAAKLPDIEKLVNFQLDHPLNKQIDKIVRRYTLYFSLLTEIIEEDPAKIYNIAGSNPKSFISLIKERCEKKYAKAKSKLWRSGWRSIIYIFLTKSIFVFAIEIPAIKLFGEPLNQLSLAINVCFPAALLLLIILFTPTPNPKNTEKIISGLKEIVYVENERTKPIFLRKPTRRNSLAAFMFNLIYGAAFLLSVFLLIKLLHFIDFNWVSITIFLFFLTFVSFFSFRIKRDIKQYMITEPKENILTFIFDFFYIPIVAMGKFLSDNISKINVFIFILDFIVETPFKIIVSVIEEWTRYLKERKDNLN